MFLLLQLISIIVVVLILGYVFWQINRLPSNRPEIYQKQPGRRAIVLAGDSITHGQIGENYIALLSKRLEGQQFDLINAGVNSHLAWNLLQRVDEIIASCPDIVTILIGTNDAAASTSHDIGEDYVKRMNLPRFPDQEWYRECLQKIVITLQEETSARIGLISIPPIGEDPDDPAFQISAEYIQSIKEVADSTGVVYLPFHERFVEQLTHQSKEAAYSFEQSKIRMFIACFKHYVLRKDWNSIGDSSGFELHIDYLHLNTKSATLLADILEEFISEDT